MKAVTQKLITNHTAKPSDAAGEVLGGALSLESVIGRGGFGVCYKVCWLSSA